MPGSGGNTARTGRLAATGQFQTAWAPNLQPRPLASSARQNKLVRASCCATQPAASPGRKSANAGPPLGSPGDPDPRPPSLSRNPGGATFPLATAGAHGPRRASVLTLRCPFTSCLPNNRNKSRTRTVKPETTFPKVSPSGYLTESSIG